MTIAQLTKSLTIAALLACSSAYAAPVELLSNGGFEANKQSAGTWSIYPNLTGWNGGTYGIELRNNVAGVAAGGVNFIELDTTLNSSISQTIKTGLGQYYTLSFQFQDRANVNTKSQGLAVTWGGAKVANVNNSLGGGWEKLSYTLIGDGSDMALKFSAMGSSDSYGTSLDNVSLTTAVPEPTTYAMLLAGLGLVGFVARRRSA